MVLEFKIFQLDQDSRMWKEIFKDDNNPNEFVIVGEEIIGEKLECYKVQQLSKNGICLIAGLKIDETAFSVEKSELSVKDEIGCTIVEFDIPNKYLTMKIIENIQRLNSY